MADTIFLPKRINVGYQNRRDTYTGKLGYITYFDEKGVLRKQKSWENWRDSKLGNDEFDNIPTSGFVLNKKVGDDKYSWFHRQSYCRIFDPRGFEFEITIDNLLYILEYVDCKCKKLTGEFVYGWDYTQLILVPTSSPDYIELVKRSEKIVNRNLTVKDLKVGFEYLGKDNKTYIYMGKHDTFDEVHRYIDPANPDKIIKTKWAVTNCDYEGTYEQIGKCLWFASRCPKYDGIYRKVIEGEYDYNFKTSKSLPKNILECTSDKQADDYGEIIKSMERQTTFSPPDKETLEFVPYTFEEFSKIASQKSSYGNKCKFSDGVYSDAKIQYHLIMNDEGKVEIKLNLSCGNDIIRVHHLGKTDFYHAVKDFKSRCRNVMQFVNTSSDIGVDLISIPYTLKEVFDILKPGYIKAYLKNGNPYMDLLKQ